MDKRLVGMSLLLLIVLIVGDGVVVVVVAAVALGAYVRALFRVSVL